MMRVGYIRPSAFSASPDPTREAARVFGPDAASLYQRLAEFYGHWCSTAAATLEMSSEADEFEIDYRPPPPKRVYYREVRVHFGGKGTPAPLPLEDLDE
jgi:hypothetical protein